MNESSNYIDSVKPLLTNHGKLIQKIFLNFHFPGRHTGRFTGKLIHSNFLTETTVIIRDGIHVDPV